MEVRGGIMKRLFPGGYPHSYEIVEHLIERLEEELDKIKEEKKNGIKWWSDIRYNRYDVQRFVYKQQLRELKYVLKEVERAEDLENSAIGNFEDEPPF